ncbi:tetratricopeptide repeat protein [Massilia dura]|uniref:Tetratricopeptide repeat protein n=1 Tax=Pseudoduganella dura TaxID=321982 RepID=A0A6I3XNG8_9BURK|nr:LytR C-terminal domain-containing protein [Pseudoduganella dura]MUI13245.1 tetratricopeptide repeat protein [Pseudoduganella dura]GGX90684.1 hypothetical protein GCM10007386_21910 [Pseudoduganella dura]
MKMTGKMVSTACASALLIACGAQPVKAPVPFASADAYYALGRAEHAAQRLAQARRAWEQALQRDPRHAAARNGMAVLLAGQGEYGKAIALWRTLVEEGEALPAAERAFLLGNLGYALHLQGKREEALAMLEQACVLDPYRPLAWEHLAAVLETLGQTDRALQMMKQARMLRTHDIGQDYAMTGTAAPAALAPAPAPTSAPAPASAPASGPASEPVRRATPWPADMMRTEVRQVGAVFELRRVAAPAAPAMTPVFSVPSLASVVSVASLPLAAPGAPASGEAGMRLEISNGNGVRGMAAAWARRLGGPQWKSVRLSNVKPFAVQATRIEYRNGADAAVAARALALAQRLGLPAPRAMPGNGTAMADLRIVLGRDQRPDIVHAGKISAQGTLQAP